MYIGRKCLQPRERQAEQIAALAIGKGVHLVDDHAFQRREHMHAVFVAEQQRQRFRGGQQDMRRLDPLACLAVRRRITRPRLYANGQAHFLNRHEQIAADVGGKRLKRRDVERVEKILPDTGRWQLRSN